MVDGDEAAGDGRGVRVYLSADVAGLAARDGSVGG